MNQLSFFHNRGSKSENAPVYIFCSACQHMVTIYGVKSKQQASLRQAVKKLNEFLLTDKKPEPQVSTSLLSIPTAPDVKSADGDHSDSEPTPKCYFLETATPPQTPRPMSIDSPQDRGPGDHGDGLIHV